MEAYTLYEEDKRDGTIPETVLAVHESEFRKQKLRPGSKLATFEVRNPRKTEKERRDQEVGATLRMRLGRQELSGRGIHALIDSILLPRQPRRTTVETHKLPFTPNQRAIRQEQQQQTHLGVHTSPSQTSPRHEPVSRLLTAHLNSKKRSRRLKGHLQLRHNLNYVLRQPQFFPRRHKTELLVSGLLHLQ